MRALTSVRLIDKVLLSAAAQCYHLTFTVDDERSLGFQPGQFLSFVAADLDGKSYTRAYSVASAPRGPSFDLCVNRVAGGFFSHYLCDMQPGETVGCHGPHGLFTLPQLQGEMLWVAAGTGIAPMRGFAQSLFASYSAASQRVTLLYQAPEQEQLFYDEEFRSLAAQYSGFAYHPILDADGDHAAIEDAIAKFTRARLIGGAADDPGTELRAYVCGLAELVKPVRARMLSLGWPKQRILFERYD